MLNFSNPGGFRNDDSHEDRDPDLREMTTVERIATLTCHNDDSYKDRDPDLSETCDCRHVLLPGCSWGWDPRTRDQVYVCVHKHTPNHMHMYIYIYVDIYIYTCQRLQSLRRV